MVYCHAHAVTDERCSRQWSRDVALLVLLRAEYATVKHFVRKHVVCKTDTLAKLAVLHQSDVTTLKRMNNMTTDHVLHSRTYVWIPGIGRTYSLQQIHDHTAQACTQRRQGRA